MREYDVIDEITADDGTPFRVVVVFDQFPDVESPRSWDCNAGRIVAISRDSRNGDAPQEDDPGAPRRTYYSRANAASIVDAIQDHPFQVVSRWLRIFHGATVVLPLWDVSTTYGATELSAGATTDNPGADRYTGVTFDTPDTRKTTGIAPEDMAAQLALDVDTYATWARGDVYGWVIQRGEFDEDAGIVWEEDSNEDSCWGYIGDEDARAQGRVALDDFIRAYDTDHPNLTIEDDDLRRAELPEAVRTP